MAIHPEVLDLIAGLLVGFPRLMVLQDFSCYDLGMVFRGAQDFMAATILNLSQVISAYVY